MRICTQTALLCCVLLAPVAVQVAGLDCQHSCDCGFAWDGADKDVTLRYEVMAGLVGAFSPLVLGGLGLLVYKRCSRPPSAGSGQTAIAAAAPMATAYPYGRGGRGGSDYDSWRGGGRGEGGRGGGNYGDYRGGNTNAMGAREPTSLYGESDDDMTGSDPQLQGGQGGRGHHRPGTMNSRYTNIHRNVKSDLTNQWLRNVNLRKY
ncbi:hypothetical protein PoB_001585600 [Plakobranchus ocellatus]|uniref:Uncharacterized protein n=1 Tax=Plakobranchus ocellatus TaxID=259542 RepID=A0AAV3Z447_9GAST|nr:hypothetical protein PoB_001585600 [Plakobranchus ocellatus]